MTTLPTDSDLTAAADAIAADAPLPGSVLSLAKSSQGNPWQDQILADQADRIHQDAMQSKQNTAWRNTLFKLTMWVVPICVAVNLAAGIWYMIAAHGQPDAAALAAWFGGIVVQVVGILLVITRHLFPAAPSPTGAAQ